MILNFINTTNENVEITFNNEKYSIKPLMSNAITVNENLLSFSISSLKQSKYGNFKRTVFSVTTNYELKNPAQNIQMHIIKHEVEDTVSYNKYIGFIIQEDNLFNKIEHSINDKDAIIKTEKKNTVLCHFISVLSNFFSIANIIFIALGYAVGTNYGIKRGIIFYLVIFSLYSVIIEFIDSYQDRKMSIKKFMTDESLKNFFHFHK